MDSRRRHRHAGGPAPRLDHTYCNSERDSTPLCKPVTLHSYVKMADSPSGAGGLNVRFGWNPAYPRDQRDEKGQRLGGKNDWMTCRPVRSILPT